ncbi:EpsG family protein [Sphingobacterium hotanense]|uniref:EpsG family protein n=1 Tax=Sphingobacterium hotanense TaxID=649196 RepID=A0ABT7NL61_9SPHI|nr:EpsG family protein [Sphingobacterium hotanense]MDM1047938.1 EpsG family protein [Sphingobacterium hotanense]
MSPINIISILLFIISPILALPTIIIGIINRKRAAVTLFILSVGFLGYLYLPNFSDDKTRYLEIYEDFRNWDYTSFILYNLTNSQDFILQLMFKIAADFGIKPQWVFYIILSMILGILFRILDFVATIFSYDKKEILLTMLLMISSLALLDLFSGTRFMLASVIALYGVFQGIVLKKKYIGLLLFIVAGNIHFSLLSFGLVYILVTFTKIDLNYLKIAFVFSFLFLIIPKDFIISVFNSIGLGGALADKADAYLKNKDFSSNYLREAGAAGVIIGIIQSIWIYLLYLFLFIKIKTKNNSYKFLFLATAVLNFFYAVPTIYLRYSIFVKLILVFLLFINLKEERLHKFCMLFVLAFILLQITNLIIMRYNIDASYTSDTFLLLDILNQEPMRSSQTLR